MAINWSTQVFPCHDDIQNLWILVAQKHVNNKCRLYQVVILYLPPFLLIATVQYTSLKLQLPLLLDVLCNNNLEIMQSLFLLGGCQFCRKSQLLIYVCHLQWKSLNVASNKLQLGLSKNWHLPQQKDCMISKLLLWSTFKNGELPRSLKWFASAFWFSKNCMIPAVFEWNNEVSPQWELWSYHRWWICFWNYLYLWKVSSWLLPWHQFIPLSLSPLIWNPVWWGRSLSCEIPSCVQCSMVGVGEAMMDVSASFNPAQSIAGMCCGGVNLMV